MASQPQPGPSTQGTAAYRATLQKCVTLVDWWLVRGEGEEIRVHGYTEKRNRATRLFRSGSITRRHADGSLVTADHKILLIKGPLNNSKMQHNGFPKEVSKYFQGGFPVQWESYANPNMKQMNENTQAPLKSAEYHIRKFLGGSFINSDPYYYIEVDSKSSKGPTGKTDGPSSQGLLDLSSGTPKNQESSRNSDHVPAGCANTDEFPVRRLSCLANGTPRNQEPSGNSGDYHNSVSNETASEGLCNGSMGMPDGSFEDPGPGEIYIGQTSQAAKPHELEVLAKGLNPALGLMQCSKENTCRTLRSGKVCGMSNGVSFKEGHSKRTVQQETLKMKVIPTEETATPSDLTCHKNGGSVAQITAADELQSKDSAHKGRGRPRKRARTEEVASSTGGSVAQITAADKLQSKDSAHKAKGLHPVFGLMQCSKENTGRALRSGKVCGLSNGALFEKGHSKKSTVQQETLQMKVIPTEETTPPSDLTCHKNGGSVAQITAADKLQSEDSTHKGRGRGRPRKRARTEEVPSSTVR